MTHTSPPVPRELAREHAQWMALGLGASAIVTVGGFAAMVLSSLVMAGSMRTIVAGGAGAIGGVLLVDLGLVATSLIAVRAGPFDEPVLGIEAPSLRTASVVLASLGIGAGALAMSFAFFAILTSEALEALAMGGFGFVAGALLVSGSGLAGLWALLHPVARPGSADPLPEEPLQTADDQ
ncbi:MAG: hypothetical protein AAF211_20045 [Myxococcota bacterium]